MRASTILSTLFITFFFSVGAGAQMICGLQAYHPVNCEHGLQALEEDMFSFVPPPAHFVPGVDRAVIINVTYTGFNASEQIAFAYAVDIWAANLTSGVPIHIDANMVSLGGSTLGFAGPVTLRRNFSGAPQTNTWYPIALANQLAGVDLAAGQDDVACTFNTDFNWYLGTDGNTPGGQYDFVSVVLHELGHGLGFIGSGNVSGGVGTYGSSGSPYIYDRFTEEGNGTDILSYASGTNALGTALTSNSVYWNGAFALTANSGTRPRLYAPSSWNGGSSYSHLNESTYPSGNANSLMTPFLGSAEAIHSPGPITYAMFEDMAWIVGGCEIQSVVAANQFPCNPATNSYSQQIQVDFINPPASGFLTVNGSNYPITSSPQTVTLNNLPSDGLSVDLAISFTADGSCTFNASNVFNAPSACCTNNRLVAVDIGLKQISIQNYGSCTIDLSNYQLCSDLACDTLSNMTLVSGALNLGAGSTLVVQWDSWVPDLSGADMDLYLPNPDYLSTDDLEDFTQWGSAGNGRESVAVAKGVWSVGDFITDVSPFYYTGNGTQNGVGFWEGSPPPCQIISLLAGIQGICNLNEYTQEVVIEYVTAPATGMVDVNGQLFAIQPSPMLVFLNGLTANSSSVNVTVQFTDDPLCSLTVNGLFNAPAPCLTTCPPDVTGDNKIDLQDLLIALADFGCTSNCNADINSDGTTDSLDLLFMLAFYGLSCP
jgi:hypothetical protein